MTAWFGENKTDRRCPQGHRRRLAVLTESHADHDRAPVTKSH